MNRSDGDAPITLERLGLDLRGAREVVHPEVELLLAHAGDELSEEASLEVSRHLAVCPDGACAAIVAGAIATAERARRTLFSDAHSFTCPAPLWDAFEALAQREGSSVDAMLTDAMRALIEQRSAAAAGPSSTRGRRDVRVAIWESARERNTPTMQRSYLPRPPLSTWRRTETERRSDPDVEEARRSPSLTVLFGGNRYEVTKPRFVVGRGGPGSDLAIDDPGVSRTHAIIERGPRGEYVLVDMGSTNGVEFQGERIVRKEIAHGDRVRIGEAELEFLLS